MTQIPRLKPKYSSRKHFSEMIDEAIQSLIESDAMAARGEISQSFKSRNKYKQIIDGAVIMAAHVELNAWVDFNFSERFPSNRTDLYQITSRLKRCTGAIEEYFEDRGFDINSLDHLKFRV